MSHAPQGGQAPDQANSGHQAGVAALTQTDHSEGTQKAAGPWTSHMRHDEHQAGGGPRQTTHRVSQSLDAERARGRVPIGLHCKRKPRTTRAGTPGLDADQIRPLP